MSAPVDAKAMWLIQKNGLYYAPSAHGYTGIKDQAGRFAHEEALDYSRPNGITGPRDGITIIREDEAPEYSPACCWDVKLTHEGRKRKAAEDRVIALEAALERIAEEQMVRAGYCQTDIDVIPAMTADEMMSLARAALSGEAGK